MILNEQDSGCVINIEVDEIVNIRLKENPTTGYRWTVENNVGLVQVDDRFEPSKAIGGEGIRVLQFRTISIGSHEFRAKKWRDWEGEGSVIKRFNIRLNVK